MLAVSEIGRREGKACYSRGRQFLYTLVGGLLAILGTPVQADPSSDSWLSTLDKMVCSSPGPHAAIVLVPALAYSNLSYYTAPGSSGVSANPEDLFFWNAFAEHTMRTAQTFQKQFFDALTQGGLPALSKPDFVGLLQSPSLQTVSAQFSVSSGSQYVVNTSTDGVPGSFRDELILSDTNGAEAAGNSVAFLGVDGQATSITSLGNISIDNINLIDTAGLIQTYPPPGFTVNGFSGVTATSGITGAGGLIITDSSGDNTGQLSFSGALTTYTGGTTVQGGATLNVWNASTLGYVTVNNGTLNVQDGSTVGTNTGMNYINDGANIYVTSTLSVYNPLFSPLTTTSLTGVTTMNGGQITLNSVANAPANTTLTGIWNINGGTITANNSNSLATVVPISGLNAFYVGFSGAFFVNGGTINLNNTAAAGTGGGGMTVMNCVPLVMTGGNFNLLNSSTAGGSVRLQGAITLKGGTISLNTAAGSNGRTVINPIPLGSLLPPGILPETLTLIGGLLELDNESIVGGQTSINSNMTIDGGTLTLDNHGAQGLGTMPYTTAGIITVNSGNVFLNNHSGLGVGQLPGQTSVQGFNVNGGYVSVDNATVVSGTNTATLSAIMGPSTVTGGKMYMNNSAAYADVDVSGGIFSVGSGGAQIGVYFNPGSYYPGNFNLSGGTHQAMVGPDCLPLTVGSYASYIDNIGTANLEGGVLDVITANPNDPTLLGQQFTVLQAYANGVDSNLNGVYSSLTSSSNLIYGVQYDRTTTASSLSTAIITISAVQNIADYLLSSTVPTSSVPPSLSNAYAMATYLNYLTPAPQTDLYSVINTLTTFILNGNTLAYQNALNQIQNSLVSVMGASALNNGTAILNMTATQMQTFLTDVGADLKADSLSFTNGTASIDPTRLAAFGKLVTNQALNPGNISNLLNTPTTTPKRKGVFENAGNFTNSPEQVNRHPVAGRTQMGKVNLWVQPYGQLTSQNGNQNGNPSVRTQTGGFALGVDYAITPSVLVGVLGGSSKTPFTWGSNRGNGQMSSGFGGLYAAWKDTSGFYIDGQTIFGGNHFTTNRTISFSNINRVATATHNAFQFTGNLELGYIAPVYDWFTCQPFILGDYLAMREAAYTETGAQSLNMSVNTRTSQFFQGEIGAMVYRTFAVDDVLLRPTAELGWMIRTPMGRTANVNGGLVNQPSSLVVTGVNKVYNQIAPGLGLVAQFASGLYASTNVYAECGGGLNIGEVLVKIGYEF